MHKVKKQRPRSVWICILGCAVLGLGFSWNALGACDPERNGSHVDCIGDYTGPEVCVSCHLSEALEMHGSVHYQQNGPTDFATNIAGLAGERGLAVGETGINTYCGTHENSPRFTCAGCHVGNGRFPMAQSEFEKLDPASVEAHAQLANIDCLMCHQEVYKRFPDPGADARLAFEPLTLFNVTTGDLGELLQDNGSVVIRGGLGSDPIQGIPVVDEITLDFQFVPADPLKFPALAGLPDRFKLPAGLTADGAAQTVHPTTRTACLNCHAGAGGGDGTKRGDMSTALRNPGTAIDQHMAAVEDGGQGMTCSRCHDAGGHRVRGRGLDLRPNDVPERFTCDNSGCHNSRPHRDFEENKGGSRDKHAMKVACQSCHIPTYAKGVKTETARDWLDPHLSQTACNGRGGWLPHEYKGGDGAAPEETLDPFNPAYQSSLVPSYAWFDVTSEVYYLGESLADVPTVQLAADVAAAFGMPAETGAFVLGMPNGDVTGGTDTKLYPMKEHWSKLAMLTAPDTDVQTLVGHSTFEFFRTGSFCRAVAVGTGGITSETPPGDGEPNCGTAEPGDTRMPPNVTVVPVHTYQTINHGVENERNALACGACHSALRGGPARMDLRGELGYELRTGPSAVPGSRVSGDLSGNLDRICSQCHGNEDGEDREFEKVHKRHVEDKRQDCAACHNFARPERNLRLTLDD